MYSMEELEKTFKKHAVQARKNNMELYQKFEENNPGEPIPEWFTDPFNLPDALASMCSEILKIKAQS